MLMHTPTFKSRQRKVDMTMRPFFILTIRECFSVKSVFFMGLKLANLIVASSSEEIVSKSMWQSLGSRKSTLRLKYVAG